MGDIEQSIKNLIFSYAERMDLGDFVGVGALFEHSSYGSEESGYCVGSQQVTEILSSMVKLYDGIPRTKHVTTNVIIEPGESADKVSARSYFTVMQSLGTGSLQAIMAGRYDDRFERHNSQWRFEKRSISMDLIGDIAEHLTVDPTAQ
jgi:hypothetical protein